VTDTQTATDWVDRYRTAWTTNASADIRALFTDDAVYEFHPNDVGAWRGIDDIVAGWLAEPDDPADWRFDLVDVATTGDTAFVRGVTTYRGERPTYDNLWVITLAHDGRASHFTEWFYTRAT
jgi:ketosteroid isomerase-like protein